MVRILIADDHAIVRAGLKQFIVPVLMLSGFAEEQYALNLLRAGAAGYLTKEAAPTELVKAIRTVVLGRKYVGPELCPPIAGEGGRSAIEEVRTRTQSRLTVRLRRDARAGNRAVRQCAAGSNAK